jgi:ADP-ribose pyrophosphatase YjhB (NUDIX family)
VDLRHGQVVVIQRIVELLRTTELADPDGRERPRPKHHDDATIAYCVLCREGTAGSQTPRHSVSVAAIVTDDNDRVLVIQRRDNGAWQPPGGVLELDESPTAGVRREVREETGVDIEPQRLTGVYKNMTLGVVALVFRARIVTGTPTETEESSAVAWWTPSQVAADMSEVFAVRVPDALRTDPTPAVRTHDGQRLLDGHHTRTQSP